MWDFALVNIAAVDQRVGLDDRRRAHGRQWVRRAGESRRRVGVGVDTDVLDLTTAAPVVVPDHAELFASGSLDAFLAAGFETWHDVRHALTEWLGDDAHTHVVDHHLSLADVALSLPFAVADYVDFYASEFHASNLGKIFRPDSPALPPMEAPADRLSRPGGHRGREWHRRRRPWGQQRPGADGVRDSGLLQSWTSSGGRLRGWPAEALGRR